MINLLKAIGWVFLGLLAFAAGAALWTLVVLLGGAAALIFIILLIKTLYETEIDDEYVREPEQD